MIKEKRNSVKEKTMHDFILSAKKNAVSDNEKRAQKSKKGKITWRLFDDSDFRSISSARFCASYSGNECLFYCFKYKEPGRP